MAGRGRQMMDFTFVSAVVQLLYHTLHHLVRTLSVVES